MKVDTVGAVRTSNGRQFQMDGAECRKARAPMFSMCEKTANRRVSADDRSDRLATAIAIFDESRHMPNVPFIDRIIMWKIIQLGIC